MKTVFSSNSEVAHVWAQGNQPEGRVSSGNVFFVGDKIYSYGYHFCMARLLPKARGKHPTVVVTTRTYSKTTKRHLRDVMRAVSHMKVVYAADPDRPAQLNMTKAQEQAALAFSKSKTPRIRPDTVVAHIQKAKWIAERANEYLAALPRSESKGVKRLDSKRVGQMSEDMQKEAERLRKKREKEAEAQRAEQRKQAEAMLVEWRSNDAKTCSLLYSIPVALRIKEDRIETSHGANIPLALAPRVWGLVQKARKELKDVLFNSEHQAKLSHYMIDSISANGDLKVGCHAIKYEEIQAIAKQLNLKEEQNELPTMQQ